MFPEWKLNDYENKSNKGHYCHQEAYPADAHQSSYLSREVAVNLQPENLAQIFHRPTTCLPNCCEVSTYDNGQSGDR